MVRGDPVMWVRVTPEQRQHIRDQAKRTRRKLSPYVQWLIDQDMERIRKEEVSDGGTTCGRCGYQERLGACPW